MDIPNISLYHREFQSQLDHSEKLRLYTQSVVSKHQALDASLAKTESKSKHWKREVKSCAEKIERVEKERDIVKQEDKVARLAALTVGEAKARAEDDLIRARDALPAMEEDERWLEAEVACLTVEQTTLLLELKASRDEVSAFHSQAGKDKKAMVEDYQKALEQIFTYGYKCYAFKHSIRSDRPRIPNGMLDSAHPLPPKFFENLGRPSAPIAVEDKAVEVRLGEVAKDPMEGVAT